MPFSSPTQTSWDCGWETDECGWNTTDLDTSVWRRQSGVTDTNYNGNTGPSSAANGSFYIYSECDHLNDETVTYQLDLVSQLDVASVSFKYFLYGKEITGVQFLYSINGSGWTSLWQKTSQVQTS